jgi:hypothetical protein
VWTQQLYFLKKLHKGPHEVRPIVSGSSGPTEKLSAFLDVWLKPLLPSIPSHIRDSSDLITKLEQLKLPKDCILATIDVKALYLSIPHKEGVEAALEAMGKGQPTPFPKSVAKTMMEIVLSN